MSIPYPSEVFSPVISQFWSSYGDSVILPLLAWFFLLVVGPLTLSFLWGMVSGFVKAWRNDSAGPILWHADAVRRNVELVAEARLNAYERQRMNARPTAAEQHEKEAGK